VSFTLLGALFLLVLELEILSAMQITTTQNFTVQEYNGAHSLCTGLTAATSDSSRPNSLGLCLPALPTVPPLPTVPKNAKTRHGLPQSNVLRNSVLHNSVVIHHAPFSRSAEYEPIIYASLTHAEFMVEQQQQAVLTSRFASAGELPMLTERISSSCKTSAATTTTTNEPRTLPNFTSLSAQGALCVIEVVCQPGPPTMTITAEPWMLQAISAEVNDDVLEISGSTGMRHGASIRISVPKLESVELSGVQTVKISKIASKEFSVDMSGMCKLELSGKVHKLWLDISGSCVVNARDLQADKVVVESSGASTASVFVGRELCASASGVSKVMYSGKPSVVNKDVSGLGVVKAKD
jgi:hypothetical protein